MALRAARLAYLMQSYQSDQSLAMIVLHGMMGSKNNFRSIVKHPSISSLLHSVYLPDLRNHGDSEHTATMTFDEMGLDLKHFIEQHDLSDLVLLGHSFGGRNIFAYLQNYPKHASERVKGVIIVDILPTPLQASVVPDLITRLVEIPINNRRYVDLKSDIMAAARSDAIGALILSNIESVEPQINSKRNDQGQALKQQDYRWRINLQGILDSFDDLSHHEFECKWVGPAKVICGDRSEYVAEENRADYLKVPYGSHLKVFPNIDLQNDIHFVKDCGHWVHSERPREFISLVSDFVKQI